MPSPQLDKIRAVVAPVAEADGYELVDVEWKHEQAGWVLRVLIDKPSGVTHEDCERMSRELSPVLDVSDVIAHGYSLEVSSPGLNRPLRTREHFLRFMGQKARVRLKIGIAGRRNFSGTIVRVGEDRVVLAVDGQEMALPLSDLDKANVEYQFS